MDKPTAWPQAQKECSSYGNGCGLMGTPMDLKWKPKIKSLITGSTTHGLCNLLVFTFPGAFDVPS